MAFENVKNKMKREKMLRILTAIVAASTSVPPAVSMVKEADAKELSSFEPTFITVNPTVPANEKGEVQVFATVAGVAAVQQENAASASTGATGNAPAAETETFEILKGIPLPVNKRGPGSSRESKYPFAKLEVGDSFTVKGSTTKTFASTISIQNKKGKAEGKWFTVRAISAGKPIIEGSTVLAPFDGVIVFRMPNKPVTQTEAATA